MKHSLKLFYTFILPSTILHLIQTTRRERERERISNQDIVRLFAGLYILFDNHFTCKPNIGNHFPTYFPKHNQTINTVQLFAGLNIFSNNHFMCKPNIRNHFRAYFPKHNQTIENIFLSKKNFTWKHSTLHVCGTIVHVPTTITNNTNWWY